MAVVGGAFETSVELVSGAAVGPRDDVVNVAASAGMSQPDGCWQWRSRTSMTRRRAPVKLRRDETEMTVAASSNRTTSIAAVSRCGTRTTGLMTVRWMSRTGGANVSSPINTVNSGRGRRAPAGVEAERVAISMRAAARCWRAVRTTPAPMSAWRWAVVRRRNSSTNTWASRPMRVASTMTVPSIVSDTDAPPDSLRRRATSSGAVWWQPVGDDAFGVREAQRRAALDEHRLVGRRIARVPGRRRGPAGRCDRSTPDQHRTAADTAGTRCMAWARRSRPRAVRGDVLSSRLRRAAGDRDWSLRHTCRASQRASRRAAATSRRSRSRCVATVNSCSDPSSTASRSTSARASIDASNASKLGPLATCIDDYSTYVRLSIA